jgi:hypothetical protein
MCPNIGDLQHYTSILRDQSSLSTVPLYSPFVYHSPYIMVVEFTKTSPGKHGNLPAHIHAALTSILPSSILGALLERAKAFECRDLALHAIGTL